MGVARNILGHSLADQTYVELVRSLFGTLLPTAIMSALFALVAVVAATSTGDLAIEGLGLIGVALSALRVRTVLVHRHHIDPATADRPHAAALERAFGLPYIAFAFVLGIFGARAFFVGSQGLQVVSVALLVGYAAGVAAGVSLRPWIGAPSMVLAVLPTVVASLAIPDVFDVLLGIVMTALLAGGLSSMIGRYRAEVEKIELRRALDGIARRDHLTDLANRLGLAERFSLAVQDPLADCLIAVHCIDLDRFKPVNDHFGHPAGDHLLRMVAKRLCGAIRHGDIAARVGGDEFVVVQRGLRHEDEAELMARRLSRELGAPYMIGDVGVEIGASLGYVVSDCSDCLDDLIAKADNALYAIKRAGGGAAAHSDFRIGKTTVASR